MSNHFNIFLLTLLVSAIYPGFRATAQERVRVAMPSKALTFLNFYVGDKFGLYRAEGLEVSLEVLKSDIGVAALVSGEMDYISAIGTAMRAAAAGAPLKATMFTMDKVIFFLMARPEIKTIQDLRGGKSIATTGLVEEFKVDRKTAELSSREIIKAFTRDGTTADDAVKAEIEVIVEQAKLKGSIPISQLVDYGLLKEVLAEMIR